MKTLSTVGNSGVPSTALRVSSTTSFDTQATLLLANKVDIKTVQTRLGHANPSITLSWYAHAIPENDHQATEMLGGILNQGVATQRVSQHARSSRKSFAATPEASTCTNES